MQSVLQDECALGVDNCDAVAICTDLVDGFNCACPAGYTGNGLTCDDIRECDENPCGPGSCVEQPGSFDCQCFAGTAKQNGICVNIDECADGIATCPELAVCTDRVPAVDNQAGYTCACRDDMRLNMEQTRCECPPGTTNSAQACVNINECENGSAECPLGAECTDLSPQGPDDAPYDCECRAGYEFNEGLGRCVDIPECARGLNAPCPDNSRCFDTPGSYTCRCRAGFEKLGNRCVPEDEAVCMSDDDCVPSSDNCVSTCLENGECQEFCAMDGCPDPRVEGVSYISQVPFECSNIDMNNGLGNCPAGSRLFSSLCGCGCIEDDLEFSCSDREFACGDGRCILNDWVCDFVAECRTGADEENCCEGDVFTCADGTQCFPSEFECDDRDAPDCDDGSDEWPENQNCPAPCPDVQCPAACFNGCLQDPQTGCETNQCADVDECPEDGGLNIYFRPDEAQCTLYEQQEGKTIQQLANEQCGPGSPFWDNQCGCGCTIDF